MTLEQCKRRYSKATLAASKAWVRYDKWLGRLWFKLSTGTTVNALNIFRCLDWGGGEYYPVSLDKVGDANAEVAVTYRKRGDKVTILILDATLAEETLDKGAALYAAASKAEDEAQDYKLALIYDFKMSIDAVKDLYRGI